MGFFDAVPVVNEVEDAAGTVATGATDTFIADPGNALLGVNAEDMGVFEENAAGAKAIGIGTAGLAGEGGLLTDWLSPGSGKAKPGETGGQEQPKPKPEGGGLNLGLILLLVVVGAAVLMGVSN